MSQIATDFRALMTGTLSLESAIQGPDQQSDTLPITPDVVMEIRSERDELDELMEELLDEDDGLELGGSPIIAAVGGVGNIAAQAASIGPVVADAFVPLANTSLESISRILQVDVPRLEQELNGKISLESIDSLAGWAQTAAGSFKSSVKNFFGRIALWWRRIFVSAESLRKRVNTIRSRAGSRKGTGGKPLKLGSNAQLLVQGDALSSDPLGALSAELALNESLAALVLKGQQDLAGIMSTRLDTLLQSGNNASAMFTSDLSATLKAAGGLLAKQPSFLLGNRQIRLVEDDGDYIIVEYAKVNPEADRVAKNAAPATSLTPEQAVAYLDAIDSLIDGIVASLRTLEKESDRICRAGEAAIDRLNSKFVSERQLERQTIDADGRPVTTVEVETTSSIGRMMDVEYEIAEVITGLSHTIDIIKSRSIYAISGVLTLVEESIIQD